ncbi:MAG: anaerobic carbon-monoxide dehydrogenase catalytic subunit [Chloroflexi bacterium]|nr:anaerobic carbon-monoxide dehydrogenase catalytic subunit [Chloroflexota bacterium]
MASSRSVDAAVQEMLEVARSKGISTAFTRAEEIKPCPIGESGNCCRICYMGPCRLVGKTTVGVCGATLETVEARNLARAVAAGGAAHSDHGRGMAMTLLAAATGAAPDYRIKDVQKLKKVAGLFGIKTEGREVKDIAADVANAALSNYNSSKEELDYVKRAPKPRQEIWRRLGITPRSIDRDIVEVLHRTTSGVDQDPDHILKAALRAALADGWGGSMMSTDISDILFGTPAPIAASSNFGNLKEDEVNIVVHGHEPTLSEMVVAAIHDPELVAYARSKGAKGVNLLGICCTANEVLVRQGVPVVGNFLSQELAITTGAVDAMVVDIQCVMQGLVDVAEQFHTKIITTSPKAKITGATHVEFDEHRGLEIAKQIVRMAIDNFPNRCEVHIPDVTDNLVAGFSHEYIAYMQGGVYRQSFRPLNDAIIAGRIRGGAGVVGCNSARTAQDESHLNIVRELIKNDVIVLTTGCNAIACAKGGLLTPEVMEYAGPGLKEVCQAIGIPPVLHMGSCIDNSRILTVLTQMATEGGLGEDISDLPVAGIAPEWMSEKALCIGLYAVASGIYTIFGVKSPISGSPEVTELVSKGWESELGGKLEFEPDWRKIVEKTLAHIDAKRKALKLEEYNPTKFAPTGAYLPGDVFTPEVYATGRYSRV